MIHNTNYWNSIAWSHLKEERQKFSSCLATTLLSETANKHLHWDRKIIIIILIITIILIIIIFLIITITIIIITTVMYRHKIETKKKLCSLKTITYQEHSLTVKYSMHTRVFQFLQFSPYSYIILVCEITYTCALYCCYHPYLPSNEA